MPSPTALLSVLPLVLIESISYTMSSVPPGPKSSWAISLFHPGCSNSTKKKKKKKLCIASLTQSNKYVLTYIHRHKSTYMKIFIHSQACLNMHVAIFSGYVYMHTHIDTQTSLFVKRTNLRAVNVFPHEN